MEAKQTAATVQSHLSCATLHFKLGRGVSFPIPHRPAGYPAESPVPSCEHRPVPIQSNSVDSVSVNNCLSKRSQLLANLIQLPKPCMVINTPDSTLRAESNCSTSASHCAVCFAYLAVCVERFLASCSKLFWFWNI